MRFTWEKGEKKETYQRDWIKRLVGQLLEYSRGTVGGVPALAALCWALLPAGGRS
jgi:hypothetical protein